MSSQLEILMPVKNECMDGCTAVLFLDECTAVLIFSSSTVAVHLGSIVDALALHLISWSLCENDSC
jgi:hypothetical protein